jgi:hypothetical protein
MIVINYHLCLNRVVLFMVELSLLRVRIELFNFLFSPIPFLLLPPIISNNYYCMLSFSSSFTSSIANSFTWLNILYFIFILFWNYSYYSYNYNIIIFILSLLFNTEFIIDLLVAMLFFALDDRSNLGKTKN